MVRSWLDLQLYTRREKFENICVSIDMKYLGHHVEIAKVKTAFARDIANAFNEILLFPSRSVLKKALEESSAAHNCTLNILSKFLGYNDWDEFLENINKDNGSDFVKSKHIKTDDSNVGDCISIAWKPNRRCTFRYLGNQKFIVEKAENSKLKVGNTFSCVTFILGEPLYLNDLVQDNNAPVAFVVGNKDGLVELNKSF
jgi:hypothetical protein